MSAAAALALGAGGAANATVYTLDVQGCTTCGNGSLGTVTVTPSNGGNTLTVLIQLGTNVFMNFAGNGFETIAFSLVNDASATITNLTSGLTTLGTENSEDHYHEDGLGSYDYAVNWTGTPQNNGGLPGDGIQTFGFTINGTGPIALDSNTVGGKNVFMSVDVAAINSDHVVNTGVIGAELGSTPVPEPATWTLMIMGVGLVGMAMRRRTKTAAAFA
jgi:hypothetical protein